MAIPAQWARDAPTATVSIVGWPRPTTSRRSSGSGNAGGPTRAPTRSRTTTPGLATTCSACTRIRAARRTWATSATTRSATSSSATARCTATPCSRRSASTRSGCPRRTRPSSPARTPGTFTDARIEELKQSLMQLGACYDWRREIKSHDPEYIRWTQWIFLRFLEAGLAYRKAAPVNWCPGCQTVLANEQVLPTARASARATSSPSATSSSGSSGSPTTPISCSTTSTTSTGPSGSRSCSATGSAAPRAPSSTCPSVGRDDEGLALRVFTTRPDTSFGMTYAVVSPEHPLVPELTTDEQRGDGRGLRRRASATDTDVERQAGKDGVFTGVVRDEPLHREAGARLRGRLRADGLRHRRHHGGARPGPARLGLRPAARSRHHPHRPAARRTGRARPTPARDLPSTARGSTGCPVAEAIASRDRLARGRRASGSRVVNYRLRDWLLSRQRFWGCPIPIVYCPEHGPVPVPDDQLPVLAPDDVEFRPTGESPLRFHEGFLHTTCPICGGPGDARDRHDGHLRRLVVVLPALRRPVEPRRTVRRRRGRALAARSTSTSVASSTPSCT